MVTRRDPARTGVYAGRVVGLATGGLAVLAVLDRRGSYVRLVELLLGTPSTPAGPLAALRASLGLDPTTVVTVWLWTTALAVVAARYGICYVVGSLVGVVYDRLDGGSVRVVALLVAPIAALDATQVALDTGSRWLAVGHVLVWAAFVPVFGWLERRTTGEDRDGPVRLGDHESNDRSDGAGSETDGPDD
ncbi:hypothetical protein RYH80_16655 [Halobaculum sp. MBLA0147]|uniref:hypothetical protein n=1 Tax=Halobaculum sp. MBLA0147 TaxID=3079934 RepID=UPI003525202F